jgi:hypothetical protein
MKLSSPKVAGPYYCGYHEVGEGISTADFICIITIRYNGIYFKTYLSFSTTPTEPENDLVAVLSESFSDASGLLSSVKYFKDARAL